MTRSFAYSCVSLAIYIETFDFLFDTYIWIHPIVIKLLLMWMIYNVVQVTTGLGFFSVFKSFKYDSKDSDFLL